MIINLATADSLQGVMTRHRVILQDGADACRPWPADASIVSMVPDITLAAAGTGFFPRARAVAIQEGEWRVEFTAPMLRPPVGGWRVPAPAQVRARGSGGRSITIAHADPESRTIRPLVDLSRIEVTRCDVGDPRAILTRWLIEAPVQAILGTDRGPRVGSGVRDGLRGLFVWPPPRREQILLSRELSYLERIRRGTVRLPELMARRLREISMRLARIESDPDHPVTMNDTQVDAQVARLTRMVRDRACAAIWFRRGELRGVFNPSPEGGPKGRSAQEFLVRMDPESYPGWVFIWHLGQTRRGGQRCLGTGFGPLQEFERDRDAFAIIDLILNYIECNGVGAIRRRHPMPVDFLDAVDLLDVLEGA